ncbi:hypothetical protein [Psychrobacillus lasiicapitis]|uniref:hypothetical protein n=1 Tax=Psychrobacillus lasiicapitis TaxID=1636719 RepID=UPI001996AF84|nr:hypothetical protein [Psychrobacillus lasiicapitis]GGA43099.1 hypothetical protein GCM10011384_36090 [Psychrobacillus lasiicapitis]
MLLHLNKQHIEAPIYTTNKRILEDDGEEAEYFYTREQLIHFLSCLEQEINCKAYSLLLLLAFSGMHKGEALALTWIDLNFTTNELRINKALSSGKCNYLIFIEIV